MDVMPEQPLDVSETASRSLTVEMGGLASDLDVLTPRGPVCVDALECGDAVLALNPETCVQKPKTIVGVERVSPVEPTVQIKQRDVDLEVGAGHPIYYRTKSISRPRVTTAQALPERVWYKFLSDWQALPGRNLQTIDVTDLTSHYQARLWTETHGNVLRASLPEGCDPIRNNSHTGYFFDSTTFKRHQDTLESLADRVEICGGPNSRGRPYRFDGSDFLRFLGWFITEGSITRSSPKNTAQISFAQKTGHYRQTLESLFDRLGLSVSVSQSDFSFGSTVYADLLEQLCGLRSANRHLPWFVWDLSLAQKRVLLDTLLAGDGDEHRRYYTASKQLASDLLRLATELGFTPRYSIRRGVWRISLSTTTRGFHSGRHVHRCSTTASLVRLTVRDYPAVLAGRDGSFQWVGVSRIA